MKLSRTALTLALLTAFTLMSSVARAQEPDAKRVKKILEEARRIEREVEKIRGRPFRTDVPKGVQSREKMKTSVVAQMRKELATQKSKDSERIVKRFGLVPESFDFGKSLADFYGSQIGGYYDPDAKRLFLIDTPPGKAMPGQELNDYMVMAHELGHALQDQYHDLSRWMRLFADNEDQITAFKSCVEGEAMLIGFKALAKKQPMMGQMGLSQFMRMNQQMAEQNPGMNPNAEKMAKIPPYILKTAMFPYNEGSFFIDEVFKRQGWKGIDKLYVDPPLSTEQILHVDKYLGDKRESPMVLSVTPLKDILGPGFRPVEGNSLGEYQTRLLLELQGISKEDAADGAEGWGGDLYQAVVEKSSGRLVLAWLSVWDSKSDAQEFFSHYSKVLRGRWKGKTHRWSLKRRGDQVLLIDGASREESLDIERHTFEALRVRFSIEPTESMLAKPPVADFEDAKRGDPTALRATGMEFKDDAARVKFRLPSEEWTKGDEPIKALARFSRGFFKTEKDQRELRFLELPFEYDEKVMSAQLERFVRGGIKDWKRLGKSSMTIAGRRAFRIDASGTAPGEAKKNRVSIVAIDTQGSSLVFMFRALPKGWDEATGGFNGLLASLEFEQGLPPKSIKQGKRIETLRGVASLVVPKGWKAGKTGGPIIARMSRGKARVTLTQSRSPRRLDFDELVNSTKSQTALMTPGFEFIKAEYRRISGMPAFILEYFSGETGGERMRTQHLVMALSGDVEMHMSLTAPAKRHGKLAPVLDGVIGSLEVLNPEADTADGEGPAPVEPVKPTRPSTSNGRKPKLY